MKILIVYASKTGVTQDIVNKVKAQRTDVDVVNLYDKTRVDLNHYDFIVIGSGIRVGKALFTVRWFVRRHRKILNTKQVAFFVSGADTSVNVNDILKRSYPKMLFDKADFAIHCGGEFRMDKLNKLSKSIITAVAKQKAKEGHSIKVEVDQEAVQKLIDNILSL